MMPSLIVTTKVFCSFLCFVLLLVFALPFVADGQSTSTTTAATTTTPTTTTTHFNSTTMAPNSKTPVEWTWQPIFVIAMLVILLLSLALDMINNLAGLFVITLIFLITGIISEKEYFSGFSNGGVASLALIYVLTDPIKSLPAVRRAATHVFGGEPNAKYWPLVKTLAFCLISSPVLPNKPQVALLVPIIVETCRASGLHPQFLLMPVNIAVHLANYFSMSSSSNLVTIGLQQGEGVPQLGFFEFAKTTVPASLGTSAFMVVLAGAMLESEVAQDIAELEEHDKQDFTSFHCMMHVMSRCRFIGQTWGELFDALPSEYLRKVRVLKMWKANGRVIGDATSVDPLQQRRRLVEKDNHVQHQRSYSSRLDQEQQQHRHRHQSASLPDAKEHQEPILSIVVATKHHEQQQQQHHHHHHDEDKYQPLSEELRQLKVERGDEILVAGFPEHLRSFHHLAGLAWVGLSPLVLNDAAPSGAVDPSRGNSNQSQNNNNEQQRQQSPSRRDADSSAIVRRFPSPHNRQQVHPRQSEMSMKHAKFSITSSGKQQVQQQQQQQQQQQLRSSESVASPSLPDDGRLLSESTYEFALRDNSNSDATATSFANKDQKKKNIGNNRNNNNNNNNLIASPSSVVSAASFSEPRIQGNDKKKNFGSLKSSSLPSATELAKKLPAEDDDDDADALATAATMTVMAKEDDEDEDGRGLAFDEAGAAANSIENVETVRNDDDDDDDENDDGDQVYDDDGDDGANEDEIEEDEVGENGGGERDNEYNPSSQKSQGELLERRPTLMVLHNESGEEGEVRSLASRVLSSDAYRKQLRRQTQKNKHHRHRVTRLDSVTSTAATGSNQGSPVMPTAALSTPSAVLIPRQGRTTTSSTEPIAEVPAATAAAPDFSTMQRSDTMTVVQAPSVSFGPSLQPHEQAEPAGAGEQFQLLYDQGQDALAAGADDDDNTNISNISNMNNNSNNNNLRNYNNDVNGGLLPPRNNNGNANNSPSSAQTGVVLPGSVSYRVKRSNISRRLQAFESDAAEFADNYIVTLSSDNPWIGHSIGHSHFVQRLNCFVMGIRSNGLPLPPFQMYVHRLEAGDQLMIRVGKSFYARHSTSGEFLSIESVTHEKLVAAVQESYWKVPDWIPCSQYLGTPIVPATVVGPAAASATKSDKSRNALLSPATTGLIPTGVPLGKPSLSAPTPAAPRAGAAVFPSSPALAGVVSKKRTTTTTATTTRPRPGTASSDYFSSRYIQIPKWWNSLSLIILLAVIAATMAGISLNTCSLVGIFVLVALGIQSPREAVKAIDWVVIAATALSFGIGSAIQNSGLAGIIANAIAESSLEGYSFFLVLTLLAGIVSSFLQDTGAVQLLYPIYRNVFRDRGLNPEVAAIILANGVVAGFYTSFGCSSNLIIAAPGNYRGRDFIAYGVPVFLVWHVLISALEYAMYPL